MIFREVYTEGPREVEVDMTPLTEWLISEGFDFQEFEPTDVYDLVWQFIKKAIDGK